MGEGWRRAERGMAAGGGRPNPPTAPPPPTLLLTHQRRPGGTQPCTPWPAGRTRGGVPALVRPAHSPPQPPPPPWPPPARSPRRRPVSQTRRPPGTGSGPRPPRPPRRPSASDAGPRVLPGSGPWGRRGPGRTRQRRRPGQTCCSPVTGGPARGMGGKGRGCGGRAGRVGRRLMPPHAARAQASPPNPTSTTSHPNPLTCALLLSSTARRASSENGRARASLYSPKPSLT